MEFLERLDSLPAMINTATIILSAVYVLAGVVCAVECDRISKMKGYFSPRYCVYGLFLNIIGLLVVIALPGRGSGPSQDKY